MSRDRWGRFILVLGCAEQSPTISFTQGLICVTLIQGIYTMALMLRKERWNRRNWSKKNNKNKQTKVDEIQFKLRLQVVHRIPSMCGWAKKGIVMPSRSSSLPACFRIRLWLREIDLRTEPPANTKNGHGHNENKIRNRHGKTQLVKDSIVSPAGHYWQYLLYLVSYGHQ